MKSTCGIELKVPEAMTVSAVLNEPHTECRSKRLSHCSLANHLVGVHSLLRALPALDCWVKEYELYGLWCPFEGAFTYLVVSFSSFEEWVS